MSWAEALIGALGGGAKSMGDQLKADQEFEERRKLLKEQSDLEMLKLEKAERLKQDAATRRRLEMNTAINDRMPGLIDQAIPAAASRQVNSQFSAARPADPSTWTPEQQASVDQARTLAAHQAQADPALREKLASDPTLRARAAADAGYLDEAKTLHEIGKGRLTQVGYGNLLVNDQNEVVVDNSQARTAERIAALERKSAPKPFGIQEQALLGKSIDDVLQGQGLGQETLPQRIAPPGADNKPVPDRAFNNALRQTVSRAAEDARRRGVDASLGEISEAANRKLQAYREASLTEAQRAAEALFGEDGRTKVSPDVAAKMRSMYGAQVPLTSPEEFSQHVYAYTFNKRFQSLTSGGSKPQSQEKPSTPEPKEAPKSAPAKPAQEKKQEPADPEKDRRRMWEEEARLRSGYKMN